MIKRKFQFRERFLLQFVKVAAGMALRIAFFVMEMVGIGVMYAMELGCVQVCPIQPPQYGVQEILTHQLHDR